MEFIASGAMNTGGTEYPCVARATRPERKLVLKEGETLGLVKSKWRILIMVLTLERGQKLKPAVADTVERRLPSVSTYTLARVQGCIENHDAKLKEDDSSR